MTKHLQQWISRCFLACALSITTAHGQTQPLVLQSTQGPGPGQLLLHAVGAPDTHHVLQVSTDLRAWTERAVLHGDPVRFVETLDATTRNQTRFYRAITRARTANDDGKNGITLPDDPFTSPPSFGQGFDGLPRWIKFLILLPEEDRVYFQDSTKHLFHHDYASKRIDRFKGSTRSAFDAVTLRRQGQTAVLGAVLVPGDSRVQEFGIQFVGADPYTAEEISRWFGLVRDAVVSANGPLQAFYIPTTEQSAAAKAQETRLLQNGIVLAGAERWTTADAIYSPGWAVGRLVHLKAGEIDAAYATGRLRSTDILLVDQVPAETPYVAGLLTLTPATPNSHVAILANSFGIPFGWIADGTTRSNALAWDGREVLLRIRSGFRPDILSLEVTGPVPEDLKRTLADLKTPGALRLQPKTRFGALSTNTTGLRPADARYFGGKAANYGLLRRVIPTNAPAAIAFSFDLWDAFMDQPLPSGGVLRDRIGALLAGLQYPPNMQEARTPLARVRALIQDEGRFTPTLETQILEALGSFQPGRKLRFRSSTNVEDGEEFTGAGLYDSYSGCMADDLDADSTGPSACDPEEKSERGVFRAIRKVYASFYNDNAFLERLRFGVDERQVGMALLVHHSYPDTEELANGVATVNFQYYDFGGGRGSTSISTRLVTQLGAVSVTNPEGTARPEIVETFGDDTSTFLSLRESSSLVALGGHVMTWETDYRALARMLTSVARSYRLQFPGLNSFMLDLEYKKVRPGIIEIKQVRRLPSATQSPVNTPAILINQPTTWVINQGEFGNVFAYHRLKSILATETLNTVVGSNASGASFYTNAALTLLRGDRLETFTGGPGNWPGSSRTMGKEQVIDAFSLPSGANGTDNYRLVTQLPAPFTAQEPPIVTQRDLVLRLEVTYATPVPSLGFDFLSSKPVLEPVREESVLLVPQPEIGPQSLLQTRGHTNATLGVFTQFYWPPPPTGPTAGYTAPAIGWLQTILTGLTPNPIRLTSPWSQTYQPFHHNFAETFLFDPALDEGVTAEQRTALQEKNLRWILLNLGSFEASAYAVGFDGTLRELR